ncbi:hypothetical protein B0I37DRAFT_9613 [Chaetomium sp. MPI-CAGE-AT-0009]|nr:hypothetical protein B0I37DRAFT_9613 [Chaetomium sp. MPI-CAGE-AT-0009]
MTCSVPWCGRDRAVCQPPTAAVSRDQRHWAGFLSPDIDVHQLSPTASKASAFKGSRHLKHTILLAKEPLELKADTVLRPISTTTKINKRLPARPVVFGVLSTHEHNQPEDSHTDYGHSELAHALAASSGKSKQHKHPSPSRGAKGNPIWAVKKDMDMSANLFRLIVDSFPPLPPCAFPSDLRGKNYLAMFALQVICDVRQGLRSRVSSVFFPRLAQYGKKKKKEPKSKNTKNP